MFKGFKDFLLRGNVVELAVAVVIGTAFTAVVTSFTESFLQPLIGLVGGGGVKGGTVTVDGQDFTWGSFVNQMITFVLTAAVIYFVVVLPLKTITERRRRGEEAGPVPPTQVELLAQIRDLLRAQQDQPAGPARSPGRHADPPGPGTTTLPGRG
ncbi:large conductance mechanosensitive channel protein MscL [Modestobacter marinus]|uniref:large conductance mechanosensitive channel protein MscL n=1 Tax=Modestobacter marinus TaxID=477641 RepID=UPI001C94797A|nr:large conductance mechanosensitive channel protein MscL [Modestobacter marinus]